MHGYISPDTGGLRPRKAFRLYGFRENDRGHFRLVAMEGNSGDACERRFGSGFHEGTTPWPGHEHTTPVNRNGRAGTREAIRC